MASRKITVPVRRAGAIVDTALDRPVRRMPEGISGVVYAGDVYPLRRDDAGSFVTLDDEPWTKSACDSFVTTAEDLVYASSEPETTPPPHALELGRAHLGIDTWSLESNKYGEYIVFDAHEDAAEELVDRILAQGVEIRRWGASVRASADGYFYDWFIRLGADVDRSQALGVVDTALAGRGTASSDAPEDPALEALRVQVDETATRMAVLAGRVNEAVASVEEALSVNEELHRLLDIERARSETARTGRERAERRVLDLESSIGRADDSVTAALRAELAVAVADSAVFEALASESQDATVALVADNRQLAERLAAVERERDELRETASEAAEAATRLARPSRAALLKRDGPLRERAWERLVLDQTVLDCLGDRKALGEPHHLLRALVMIDVGSDDSPGAGWSKRSDIKNCDNGWEVRFRTGTKRQESMGRLYYRDFADGRLVFAQRKDGKNQDRLLQRVRAAVPEDLAN